MVAQFSKKRIGMARGKTQKRSKSTKSRKSCSKVLTIPQLRQSLDYISSYADSLVKSGMKLTDESVKSFASEWKRTFGKTLPESSARSYLENLMKMKKSSRRTRKYRGGAQNTMLTGAPNAYMTRPGTDIPYGNFLEYVGKGFWNPEPAIKWDPVRQPPVIPYAETGSNKMNGGGFFDGLSMRPFTSQNPTTPMLDAMYAWKGQPLGPGPESYQRAYTYQSSPVESQTILANPVYTRSLQNDIQSN
jgi:hypothetical protein